MWDDCGSSSSGTISSSRLCGMTVGVPLVPLAVAGCVVCGMTLGVPVVSRPSRLLELPRACDSTPDDKRRQINSLGIVSPP